MTRLHLISLLLGIAPGLCWLGMVTRSGADLGGRKRISLCEPRRTGSVSVEAALQQRRSRRSFKDLALTEPQLSQILWSAQGITEKRERKRAAPSAGATYPMKLYVLVGETTCGDLPAGVYSYVPDDHGIELHAVGDRRRPLASAALEQGFVAQAPLVVVLAAKFSRTIRANCKH